MKFYIEPIYTQSLTDTFDGVFKVSNIDFEFYDRFEDNSLIPPEIDCTLSISYLTFYSIFKQNKTSSWLENFFKKNSYLILNQPLDSTLFLLNFLDKNIFDLLKKYKSRILLYYTGQLNDNVLLQLKEFNLIKRQESENIVRAPKFYKNIKIENLNLPRKNCFLLTTVLKDSRLPRKTLVKELNDADLLKYHIGKTHNTSANNDHVQKHWVGHRPIFESKYEFEISHDLYNQVSFEIVPETLYDNASFVTEKTLKPIVARIPFLILSNCDYYQYLKSIGFKTFDSLIDESFAYEENLENRIKKLVSTAKNILDNNSIEFYHAAKEICEYNFDHCLYLTAKDQHTSYNSLYNFKQYLDTDSG